MAESSAKDEPTERPGAGVVLEQEQGVVGGAVERLGHGVGDPGEGVIEAGAHVRADVEDDAVGTDARGEVEFVGEGVGGLAEQFVVGRGEVDQVDGVDEGGLEFGLFELLAVGLGVFVGMVFATPHLRGCAEDLERLRAQVDGSFDSLMDPSGGGDVCAKTGGPGHA